MRPLIILLLDGLLKTGIAQLDAMEESAVDVRPPAAEQTAPHTQEAP